MQDEPPELWWLECPPKAFEGSEYNYYGTTTKGTIQYMSTCGAKFYTSEMATTESISAVFADLSVIMPLLSDDLHRIVQEKLSDENRTFKADDGRLLRAGASYSFPMCKVDRIAAFLCIVCCSLPLSARIMQRTFP